jgi:hypothetical protein
VRPANDAFADATLLPAEPIWMAVSGNGRSATWEPGEPETSGWPDTGSVWFRWVPARARQYTLRFTGPEGTELDGFAGDSVASALPFFRGGSVDSTPSVYFAEGVPSYLRVSRRWQPGGAGPFRIELYASPANDDFTNSVALPVDGGTFSGANRSASLEPGEPFWGCYATLWWHWTAPADGEITLGAADSDCSVVGAVFRGDAVAQLTMTGQPGTLLAIGGPFGWKYPGYLVVRVRRGITYHLALGSGSGVEGPTSGTIEGTLSFRAIPNLPPNDDFADRTRLAGAELVAVGSTTEATREPGELPETGQRTIWWEWSSPADGVARLWLESASFSPVLMLFRLVDGFGLVEAYPRLDRLNFTGMSGPFVLPVKAGDTFQISAGEPVWSGGPGPVTLRLEMWPLAPPPSNDALRNATRLEGAAVTSALDLFGATFEAGEPSPSDGLPPIPTYSGSLWWKYTPAADGRLTIQLAAGGGGSGPIVGLHRGTSFANLELLTHAFGGPIVQAVQGGEEYRISVAGPCLAPASFALQVNLQDLVPTNNSFAGSLHLAGTNLTANGSLFGCNREVGEPNHALFPGETLSGESAWWSWVAPFTGKVVVNDPGTDDFRLAVYTGPAVDRLVPVSASRQVGRLVFAAQVDLVYHFGLERTTNGSGWVAFSLEGTPFAPGSPNDDFANAFPLRGLADGALAANLAATREPGEPAHRPGGPNKSIWWRWVLPNSGLATVANWEGTLRNVTLAVYTGNSVDTLSLVAKGADAVQFEGRGGETYHLAAETGTEADGDVDLHVSCAWPDGRAAEVPGNLVQNYSFEELLDGRPIARWTATNGFIGVVGATGAEGAADGQNYLVLSGNKIEQDLATVIGQPYRIRLAVLGTDQDGPARVTARFGGASLPDIVFTADGAERYWHWYEFSAVATSTTTHLAVESTGVRVGLDAVSVVWQNQPPRIVTPPEGKTAYLGAPVSFHAGVEGASPLLLQWELNGGPLAEATGPTLYLAPVTTELAGWYTLVARNAFGAVTSAPVRLQVEVPARPAIVLQPQGQTVAPGEYVALVVGAIGTPPLRYQWYQNGQPVPDATNRHLVIPSYGPDNAGEYVVRVANAAEAVTSLPASLWSDPAAAGGGQVWFANWWPDPDEPIKVWVYDVDGVTRLAGETYLAQLCAGLTADSLRPVGEPQPFLKGFSAGIWQPVRLTLPHVPPGTPCFVQARVWEAASGASYPEARALGGRFGRSAVLPLVTGGEGPADPPPARLTGLRRFSLSAGLPEFNVGELTLLSLDAAGTATFRLHGQAGFRYLIEKRVEPGDWQPYKVLEATSGNVEFTDTVRGTSAASVVLYRSRILD